MENLIYYPGFEIIDPNWLKFALLYIDRLNPIIPSSGDDFLSDLHFRLSQETDLIVPHRPEIKEGKNATFDSLKTIDRILRNPERYFRIFGTSQIVDKWKQPENQNYTLFEDKYTYEWDRFCTKEGFAKRSDYGIKIPKELGLIYMTILAQAISESRGVSPITDHKELDKFSILMRDQKYSLKKKFNVAKSVINLKLPSNLHEIGIDKIIAFRNKNNFKAKLKSFHQELNEFLINLEEGSTSFDFVRSFNSIWSDFSDDIVQLGLGTSSFGLGVWILINSKEITTAQYLKEVVVGGAALTVGSIISIRNTWKKTKTKRYTRKYLADLERLA